VCFVIGRERGRYRREKREKIKERILGGVEI